MASNVREVMAAMAGTHEGARLQREKEEQQQQAAGGQARGAGGGAGAASSYPFQPLTRYPYQDDAFGTILQWLYHKLPDTRG